MSTAVVFDPLDAENLSNPYPLYARMRDTVPVMWDERLGSWLLTRHSDCVTVLRNPEQFASDPRRAGELVPDSAMTIQMQDPPDHGPARSNLTSACRRPDLLPILRRTRDRAAELLESFARTGSGELMTGFAAPLSLFAICDFLGVPSPELATMMPIGDAFMRGMDAGLRPEQAKPAAEAGAKLSKIFETWFSLPPKSGVLGALFARSPDNCLPPADVNNVFVLFNSGYLSVSGAIGNAVLGLLRCRQDLTQLLDPQLLDRAVDELLRHDGYVQAVNRVCVEDAELGGMTIRRGENIILLIGAANRDPEQFASPDDLVLDRTPNRHLEFGWGIHSCLGSFFARETLKIALSSLLEKAAGIRLAGEPVHKPQATVRCLDCLPVAFGS